MHIVLFVLFVCFQVLYIIVPLIKERPKKETILVSTQEEKGISILVPAYNEETVIEKCVLSLLDLNYTNYEIIIINDGSSDNTIQVLKSMLDLEEKNKVINGRLKYKKVNSIYSSKKYPKICVIDKDNGGKADSLNAGIDYSENEIVITLDADSILEKNSLKHICSGFNSEKVVAVGGMVNIIQGFIKENDKFKPSLKNANALVKHQTIQYLAGFYLNKFTHSCFNCITVIAGAFGAFKKDVLFSVGGFRKTVGEDMDITLKFQKYIKQNKKGEKMLFVPDAMCYTQCPEDFKNLITQRFRWQRAFIDCVIYYWNDLFKNFSVMTSIYLLFDSLILGTLVSYFVPFIPIIMLFSLETGVRAIMALLITSFTVSLIQNICILIVSKRYEYKLSFKDYIKYICFSIYDSFTYRFLGIFYATIGTISYFTNTVSWKKIKRVEIKV